MQGRTGCSEQAWGPAGVGMKTGSRAPHSQAEAAFCVGAGLFSGWREEECPLRGREGGVELEGFSSLQIYAKHENRSNQARAAAKRGSTGVGGAEQGRGGASAQHQ